MFEYINCFITKYIHFQKLPLYDCFSNKYVVLINCLVVLWTTMNYNNNIYQKKKARETLKTAKKINCDFVEKRKIDIP